MDIQYITQILQASIAPCVLISGLGLMLLVTTNRFSRPVDRIRLLVDHIKRAPKENQPDLQRQIRIFYHRSRLLRRSIGFIAAGIIFVSSLMLMLFSSYVFAIPYLIVLIKLAFTLSLLCLILALILFLMDIRLTLRTIEIEASEYLK